MKRIMLPGLLVALLAAVFILSGCDVVSKVADVFASKKAPSQQAAPVQPVNTVYVPQPVAPAAAVQAPYAPAVTEPAAQNAPAPVVVQNVVTPSEDGGSSDTLTPIVAGAAAGYLAGAVSQGNDSGGQTVNVNVNTGGQQGGAGDQGVAGDQGAAGAPPAVAGPAQPAGAQPAQPAGEQPAGAQPAQPGGAQPAQPAGPGNAGDLSGKVVLTVDFFPKGASFPMAAESVGKIAGSSRVAVGETGRILVAVQNNANVALMKATASTKVDGILIDKSPIGLGAGASSGHYINYRFTTAGAHTISSSVQQLGRIQMPLATASKTVTVFGIGKTEVAPQPAQPAQIGGPVSPMQVASATQPAQLGGPINPMQVAPVSVRNKQPVFKLTPIVKSPASNPNVFTTTTTTKTQSTVTGKTTKIVPLASVKKIAA